jgi:Putative abortive phage resistance protein AbiGi, antitoxin
MDYNPISADTLFHYTSSISILESILINEFYPRYCLEDHSMFNSKHSNLPYLCERAIPMVCFCDIPLSSIRNHAKHYGNYAIGLSKDWGKSKGISPVLYTYEKAITAGYLRGSYHESVGKLIDKEYIKPTTHDFIAVYLELFIFMSKPYEGSLWRNGKHIKGVRFYDEREWRYVPSLESMLQYGFQPSLTKDEFNTDKIRDDNNAKLTPFKLSFSPSDIKYIILDNESEVLEFIRKLRYIKAKYSTDDIDLLTTRIITMEQIKKDF